MTAQGFAAIASMRHGVKAEAILNTGCRWSEVVAARWDAWRMARDAGWEYARIARAFGVHHTTVMHALRAEK